MNRNESDLLVENTGERGMELKSDKGNRASYTYVRIR